jgi:NitT/TauT family transport system substrate-binding protein
MRRRGLREIRHELSRRDLLRLAGIGLSGLGLAAIAGCRPDDGTDSPTSTPGIVVDPPPETTTIRLGKITSLPRAAPFLLAEQFLPAEGFTNVQYTELTLSPDQGLQQVAAGEIDIGLLLVSPLTVALDRGDPLVILAGVNSSLFEMFGNDEVRSLRDLKGKSIAGKRDPTDPAYPFWAALLAYVGIDVETEVEFVEAPLDPVEFVQAWLAGAIDAVLLTRPNATTFRNAKIGHVIIDGLVDPPWSQHFVTMATGNRDFVEKHPAATKRALRAILKATDVCARDPERAARYLVDKGYTPFDYDVTLDGIPGRSYAAWREFDPEDTLRFYALRLEEAGLVKSTPDELIARATDWRYLNKIKRELGVA